MNLNGIRWAWCWEERGLIAGWKGFALKKPFILPVFFYELTVERVFWKFDARDYKLAESVYWQFTTSHN